MDMKDLEDVAHRYKKATDALDVVRTEMQGTAVALLQQGGVKQADVARVTGWSREHLRRLKEKAEMEALRRKVEELSAPAEPPTPPRGPSRSPDPQRQTPARKPVPEPNVEGRPLLDDEAKRFAELARSRAKPLQIQAFDQATETASGGLKDYVVVSSAMAMGLLTHDEVYGEGTQPAGE